MVVVLHHFEEEHHSWEHDSGDEPSHCCTKDRVDCERVGDYHHYYLPLDENSHHCYFDEIEKVELVQQHDAVMDWHSVVVAAAVIVVVDWPRLEEVPSFWLVLIWVESLPQILAPPRAFPTILQKTWPLRHPPRRQPSRLGPCEDPLLRAVHLRRVWAKTN